MSPEIENRFLQLTIAGGSAVLVIVLVGEIAELLGWPVMSQRTLGSLLPLGMLLVGIGVVLLRARGRVFDERFLLNRLKATRVATVIGMAGMCFWLVFDFVVRDLLHWQLLVILGAMAVGKVASILYFQKAQ